MPGDLLQPIRKCRKVDMCENYGQEVHRRVDRFGCRRTFKRFSVALAHSLQKSPFIAAIVNQHRLLNCFEDGEKFPPDLSLVSQGVCPQAMMDRGIAVADA